MTWSSKAIALSALFFLMCIGTLSYWSEVRNDRDRDWVIHTLHVVEKLQTLRIDITLCETGQRGYMLTGQDRYMKLYDAGVTQVRLDLRELPDLTSDNPGERKAITQLDPLIASWLAELAEAVEVRQRSGLLAGVEAVRRANKGEKWMGQIQTQIGGMRDTEAKLLSSRLATATTGTRKIKLVILYGNSLAILIVLVKGLVLHREIGKRNSAERRLRLSNEQLERRTAELSETNVELESFAYSVAHDLRAPLRHIAGYSGVLMQDYASRLDGEGLRYLGKIADRAQKMGQLVDDLLSLSQVGRQELALQPVSLDLLLEHSIEEVTPEWSGRKVEWRIGKLFRADCDPGLMKQVFVNLLSNAVKYSQTRPLAVIEVGQVTERGERAVFVRDNGVGFEMKYAGKLFGVFERLHKTRDFEGTGVGLAIVQRIVRRHGGRVWAEAEVDGGATFFFTIGIDGKESTQRAEAPARDEIMFATPS